jgi:cellulose synthase/poly-beta-1,6-N-acetylglucosamine synthase-like glycosyltransferase
MTAAFFHAATPLTHPWLVGVLLLVEAVLLLPALPLLIELLVLSLAAALPRRPDDAAPTAPAGLTLTVIVPAHNEEKSIAQCVRSLLASSQAAAGVRITVIAHNCADRTAEVAREAGAQALVLNEPVGGKGVALDFAMRAAISAGAAAVLVVDADSLVEPNLIPCVLASFAAGAQAIQCRYEVANPELNHRTRLAALAFRGINVLRPLGRSRLGLSCGIFGNGFGLSAATIARVPYIANSIVEDLEYHLHLIRAGIRVEFLNQTRVIGEMPQAAAAAATQRARWEGGRILMRRRWSWPLLAEVAQGRLKLLEPLLDLLALPLAAVALRLVCGLIVACAADIVTPAAWRVAGPIVWPAIAAGFLTLVLYVGVAARLGPDPGQTLLALASLPGYLLWKIALIPRTRLAARANAAWIRTARNADAQPADVQPGDAQPGDAQPGDAQRESR